MAVKKMIHTCDKATDATALEREGRLAYSMSHPNVVKIYGVVITEGHSLMAMGIYLFVCFALRFAYLTNFQMSKVFLSKNCAGR